MPSDGKQQQGAVASGSTIRIGDRVAEEEAVTDGSSDRSIDPSRLPPIFAAE